jgi:hypothetical protein
VEQYFKAQGTLPTMAYWHGVVRNAVSFTFADGSPVPNNYSDSPYAHWGASYLAKLAGGGLSCVLARGSLTYDFFVGDTTQLGNRAYYSSSSDNKYGWVCRCWPLRLRHLQGSPPCGGGTGCASVCAAAAWEGMSAEACSMSASHYATPHPPQLGPGKLRHWHLPVHLRDPRHLVPLPPPALALPAAALAARGATAPGAAHL